MKLKTESVNVDKEFKTNHTYYSHAPKQIVFGEIWEFVLRISMV